MKIRNLARPLASLAVLVGFLGIAPDVVAQRTQAEPPATPIAFPAADVVFPEGVAVHPVTGQFFVGSTANGAVYRGEVRRPERGLSVFLPGGADGRTTAIGMKVDAKGYLWIAGGATGKIWMYDSITGRLLSEFWNGLSANTFVNDITVTPDGAIYATDSNTPILYRVAPDAQGVYQFSYWLDFRGTALEYTQGFNLNGITSTADGKYLVVVQSNTGKLFRIATASKEVAEIPLAGGDRVTSGDGILLDGSTLYVTRNSLGLIVKLELAADLSSGKQVGSFTSSSFRYPTTIAKWGDRLLVVNSQFNRRGTPPNPELPFTTSLVTIP